MFLRYRSSAWDEGIVQDKGGMRVRGNISMIEIKQIKIKQKGTTSTLQNNSGKGEMCA